MAFGKDTLDAEQHNRIAQVLHHLGIIAERADQGVVITDREGTIHFSNTAWASMHGYTKSRKILGRGITSFFDKLSSRDNLIKLVKQAKNFGCASAVLQHQKLDRSIFPSRNKIIALKDKNGCPNALIFFSTDISEIENLQKQLTETTNKLQGSRRQIELLNRQLDDLSRRSEAKTEQKNQPSTALPTEEKLEQTCPEHSRGKNPPLTQPLLESKISSRRSDLSRRSEAKTEISTCSEHACPELVERVESTQDAAPANSSKTPKHAPKPFNAERLKALAYLSRRLNEPPTPVPQGEAPQPPLHKLTDRAYADDNLENSPCGEPVESAPLLDIEQLKAVAEIAKRLA